MDSNTKIGKNIIIAEKIVKVFGHIKALKGIDLTVQRGEFLTILGPNGAGKTTLIKILTSLLKPTSGRLLISGIEPRRGNTEKLKRIIGVISHSTFLYDNLTGLENLKFYASMYGCGEDRERMLDLLNEVGLYKRMHDPVRTYSRGMQQRLSIARGLIHRPEIVFLDEPYTGLDQHAAKMLQKILSSIHSDGRTVVMVSHNLPRALELSETIAIISQGTIVYHSAAKDIKPEEFESLYLETVDSSLMMKRSEA
ncbi:MAG: ABC transporter ATP-binding protein [Acidobacteriota bacterium]